MAVYAISDLHGCYNLYKLVKDFIKSEDKVYVLGDCADRGPQSWETVKAIYNDPQFIYIKGNHEDMLVKAMNYTIRTGICYGKEYSLCRSNGGEKTFKDWLKENDKQKIYWRNAIDSLPLEAIYLNKNNEHIYMSHSGADENASEEDHLWDRDHFFHWTSKYDIIVHGHTPISLMDDDFKFYGKNHDPFKLGAYWYENHRKVNIDCGSVWTGVTVLLNLDTFEEHIFRDDKNKY